MSLAEKAGRLPTGPGVYLFKNDRDRVLYVGKARDLRARLSSYRRPGGDGRVQIPFLERDARSVETIVTRTEGEAILLEDTPHEAALAVEDGWGVAEVDACITPSMRAPWSLA